MIDRALRAGLLLAGCCLALPSCMGQDTIRVDGSSTVFRLTEAVAEEFQMSHRGKRVVVGISGTGGGFKKFYRGETDVTNASRPILSQEMEECRKNGIDYIELPIAFDAITVMVNPSNRFVDRLTVEELKKLWEPAAQGKVLQWNQIRADWPSDPIKLYGAGADSGTFDYFTEAVVGVAKSSRGDFTASEDDNVLVQGISRDRSALGYFGYSYYVANRDKLKAVPIVNPAGEAVAPTEETVMSGAYAPLSRPVFLYVNKKSLSRPEVRQYVEFYLKNAANLAKEVNYVPLPGSAYEAGLARIQQGLTGTAFGGHSQTGVHIDELMKRPLSNTPKEPE